MSQDCAPSQAISGLRGATYDPTDSQLACDIPTRCDQMLIPRDIPLPRFITTRIDAWIDSPKHGKTYPSTSRSDRIPRDTQIESRLRNKLIILETYIA